MAFNEGYTPNLVSNSSNRSALYKYTQFKTNKQKKSMEKCKCNITERYLIDRHIDTMYR